MTRNSIETGRGFAVTTTGVTVNDDSQAQLVSARGDRVALSVAAPGDAFPTATSAYTIGIVVGGVLVPLTTLTTGHPACYLSVDKIGSAICPVIVAYNHTGNAVTLGVTEVRQTQPWGDE